MQRDDQGRDGRWGAGRALALARAEAAASGSTSALGTQAARIPGEGSAEQLLLDAAGRARRLQSERVALVLHLGRFGPPPPEPHHCRIARALLTEAAQRHDGQLYALGNGDLVLLCRPCHGAPGSASQDEALSLRESLVGLFGLESREPDAIVSLWPLPARADLLLGYAAERLSAFELPHPSLRQVPSERIEVFPRAAPPAAAPLATPVTAAADFPELLRRRTGVLIACADRRQAHSFSPLFREIALSPASLWARYAPPGDSSPDAWSLRHFAHRLDERLLALIEAALPGSGPLGMAGTPHAFALHLSLSAKSLVRERCAHFFQTCHSIGVAIGIEVSLVEAAASPEAFAAARAVLRGSGNRLLLGGISHQALLLIRPGALDADFFKLEWSPRLGRLSEADPRAVTAALGAIGPERVILSGADNEAAVLWGLGHGIHRFVGHHVEIMLAAGRMLSCPAAQGCTLGQCAERAASPAPSGRRFCRNLALLDFRVADPGLAPPGLE